MKNALEAKLSSEATATQFRADIAHLVAQVNALSHEGHALQAEIQRLEKRAKRAECTVQIIGQCAKLMNSSLSLSLNEMLGRVLSIAVGLMKAERGFLALRHASDSLEIDVFHHFDRSAYEDEQHVSRSIVARVFSSGRQVVTTDTHIDRRSIICVPLRVRATTIGVLYLDCRILPNLFGMSDPTSLIAFANLAAATIENARLFAQERAGACEIRHLEVLQTRILETIAGGVITINQQDRIIIMNDAAERSLSLTSGALVGSPMAELERYIPGLSALLHQARSTGTKLRQTINTRILKQGLRIFELQIAVVDTANTVVVFNDLSAQQQIQDALSRYLAPHVVQSLLRNPTELHLGGERQRATILFADICGFTERSARMKPEEVVALLNRYLERAVAVIFEHEGLLDKFYGDGIMAVFGPPLPHRDDAERALKAAVALLKAVDQLNTELDEPIRISIGIASGTVVAGHIGSPQRAEYTVIGDAVNLASRLEADAEPGSILCDEATYQAARLDLPVTPFVTSIRGRAESFTIYRL